MKIRNLGQLDLRKDRLFIKDVSLRTNKQTNKQESKGTIQINLSKHDNAYHQFLSSSQGFQLLISCTSAKKKIDVSGTGAAASLVDLYI